MELEGDIEENTLAIEALQSTVATNEETAVDLNDIVDDLEGQIEFTA